MKVSALLCAALALGLVLTPAVSALAQSSSGSAQAPGATTDDHAGHAPAKPAGPPKQAPQESALPRFIPPLTDEDRQAAFPDVEGHTVHDRAVHSFTLFDRLEWQGGDAGGISLDTKGWIGRDRDRLWFRAEGGSEKGHVDEAQAHLLFGRQFARWWDIVGGIRQDFSPGPAQTWAAIGVQGLAPYWFEVEATAYVGASGRTQARFEVEYELYFTNHLVLQPLLEVELAGKSDPERRIGAGLSATDAGLRLRYEIRREFAPYIGVAWNRKYGKTAEFAGSAGDSTSDARLVTGVRLWF